MADFDPVTDFLTREQEALGELGSEINFGEQQSNDVFATTVNSTDPQDNGSYVFLNGESKPEDGEGISTVFPPAPVSRTDSETFPSQPQMAPSSVQQQNPFSNGLSDSHDGPASVFGTMSEPRDEAWRQEFNERVARKDAEEEKLLAELKETGKQELENWYKHYRSQLKTRAREIREARSAADCAEAREQSVAKPTVADKQVWDKVCNMCDFQAKQKSAPDMTRMRGILLSLKPTT